MQPGRSGRWRHTLSSSWRRCAGWPAKKLAVVAPASEFAMLTHMPPRAGQQARADSERQATEAAGSRVAPLEAELRGVAEAAERYRAERDFLHAQLTSAATARAQLEASLQEARVELLAAQQQQLVQQQRAREESEALASGKGGPASQLLASARRSRELAAEKERETQMEEALRLAETARVASQVAQAEVAALRERSDALRSERDDAKSEAHRWEARYRDMVAQRASSPAALSAMPSAAEALSQLHQADLSISESSHLAEQLSAAKDELHRLRTAHDAALARLAQQGRLLAAAAAASVDARRAAAAERETFAEPVAASGGGDRGDGRHHEGGGRLAASVVCARLETLLVEVQGVAGAALASGGARWDDDAQDADDEETGSPSVTPGEAVARHALAKARTALVDLEAKQRDGDGDMVRALLELKALCLHVIVVCAAMARRKQQPERRGRMSQGAAQAAWASAPGGAQRHYRVSQETSSHRSGGADDDLGGPAWHQQHQQEAAQHHRPSRQRETAVISPTPVPADDSPRDPPNRRGGGAAAAATQHQPVRMLQRRGQSRSASPYGRRSTEGDRVDRSVSPHPSWWANDRYMRDADDGARAAALTRRASSAQGRHWGRDAASAEQGEQQHSRGGAYGRRPDTPPVSMQRAAPVSPYAASAARGASALAARRHTPLRSSADNTVFPAPRAPSPAPPRPRSAAESRPAWSHVSAGTPVRMTRTGLMPREPASSPTVRVAMPKWR
jgi:hypothetical protein